MESIEKLLNNESMLQSLTGYKKAEFEHLCQYFSKEYHSYITHYQIDSGKPRVKQVRKIRKNATLPTDSHRLLFVLYYMKLNPLQDQMAFQFNMTQAQVSRKLKRFIPILERSLDLYLIENEAQIEQNSKRIHHAVKKHEQVLLDVTERPIQRNMDNEQQQEDFSGKKKTLRKKPSSVLSTRIYFIRKPNV